MAGTVQLSNRNRLNAARHTQTTARTATASSPRTGSSSADRVTLSSESDSQSNGRLGGLLGGLEANYGSNGTTERGRGNTANAQANARARQVYRNHAGNAPLNLDNRGDVGRLISRSPQVDNMSGRDANNDQDRCGGAAIFNGMLLDGDHHQNAGALRALAERRHEQNPRQFQGITDRQNEALQAMDRGEMTPSQAAVLQELTYDVANARDGHTSGPQGRGLNDQDMATTVGELRELGAFPNTEEMNFRREHVFNQQGQATDSHWTVSTRNRNGRVNFADSAPRQNGYATVTGGDQASFAPFDHSTERPHASSVVFQRGGGSGGDAISNRWPGEDQMMEQSWTISGPRAGHSSGEHPLPSDRYSSN